MPYTWAVKIILLMWMMTAPDSGKAVPGYVATAAADFVCADLAKAMNEKARSQGGSATFTCHTEADFIRIARECHPGGCKR